MTDEQPRLYSKERKGPRDVVAEQHQVMHGHLERWGANQRGGAPTVGTCDSFEGNYNRGDGRETKRPVVALPPNALYPRISRAVRVMPMQHGETIRLYYVGVKAGRGLRYYPAELVYICRLMSIRWEDFGTWMFDCRAMVRNVLRSDGVALDE